ncbi:MAG: flagellar basal body P-ring protein FlgI [Pirellulales bacterium]
MSRISYSRWPKLLATLSLLLAAPQAVEAKTLLKNICRVKGQEQNTLQGMGLVVGLRGTGDGGSFLPAMRSLAQAMQLMANPLGKAGLLELKDAKNVALVMVTATVPAAGARQGDRIDCMISSAGAAKSLAGGRLFMTALMGPQTKNQRVFAFAEGAVHVEDTATPTTARVTQGCRLEEDFYNPFVKDGKLTLVLDENHADWQVAQDVAELVNSQLRIQSRYGNLARAINQVNIEVTIPQQYADEPVLFVSQVLSLPMLDPQTTARVVINEKAGSVVISGDVEIGAVVVTHKNVVIEAGVPPPADRFVALDSNQTGGAKLQSLVESLNALKVPTADIIDIIKGIEKNGKLHGKLIVE